MHTAMTESVSLASSFWRGRTQWRKNWFLHDDPNPDSIFSVYERLEYLIPLVAREYNGAGALVSARGTQEIFVNDSFAPAIFRAK
jgi:hypothetical protein